MKIVKNIFWIWLYSYDTISIFIFLIHLRYESVFMFSVYLSETNSTAYLMSLCGSQIFSCIMGASFHSHLDCNWNTYCSRNDNKCNNSSNCDKCQAMSYEWVLNLPKQYFLSSIRIFRFYFEPNYIVIWLFMKMCTAGQDVLYKLW